MVALFIFDTNHVLLKTQGKGRYNVRPNLELFVQEILKLLASGDTQIAFWTSKPEGTARPILEGILGDTLLKKALFSWYRDACTPVVIDNNPFHTRKNLSKVWDVFPVFNQSNTFLIDDSPEKCADFPDNLLQAPAYLGPRKSPGDEGFTEILQMIRNKLTTLQ